MKTAEDLRRTLRRIDGRGYKAYKDIEGVYDCGDYILFVDRSQGDPFASPSRVRVRVPQKVAGFPKEAYQGRSREIA
ncbi:MAG: ATPase, partial [Candidatus Latescibacterota bacterium]